jgi:hypothetical protein
LIYENKIPIGIHQPLLAFYCKDTVDINTVRRWLKKSRDTGGQLNLNDQPHFGRPVTATHDLEKQKVDEFFKKIHEFSDSLSK